MTRRTHVHSRLRAAAAGLVALLGTCCVLSSAHACSTPVYRYAMYRWIPDPYAIFFFHYGTPDEEDVKVHEMIRTLAEDETRPVNFGLYDVDLNEDPELEKVPPLVREKWTERSEKEMSTYMIINPFGLEVHFGGLDEEAVTAMVDSPMRQKLAKTLEKGVVTVLIMIECDDAKANAKAEEEIGKLIKAVAEGELELYVPPTEMYGQMPEEEEEDEEGAEKKEDEDKAQFEIALLKISRTDPKEQWLIRLLLGIENDLDEFKNEPMVFPVFGRGRALKPFIGKGIHLDNLVQCVYGVTDACSCTVQWQNPGMYLLTQYDWEGAAQRMSERFATDEAVRGRYSDLFLPSYPLDETLADASGTDDTGTDTNSTADNDTPADDDVSVSTSDDEADPSEAEQQKIDSSLFEVDTPDPSEEKQQPPSDGDGDTRPGKNDDPRRVASSSNSTTPGSGRNAPGLSAEEPSRNLMLTMGIGIAVSIVALMAATFFLLKRN